MFRPVKLTRVTIQTPEESISEVMAILGDLRLLHLIRVEETHLGRMGYMAHIDTSLLERYEALLVRLNRLLAEMEAPGAVTPLRSTPRPDQLIFRLEEECQAIEKESLDPLEQRIALQKSLAEHQTLMARLLLLESAAIDLDRLRNLRYASWHAGLIPEENFARLESSLGETYHSLIPIDRKQGRIILMVMMLKENEAVVLRALKSAFWDPLEISAELHGTVASILERLTAEGRKIQVELGGLDTKRQELAARYGLRLRQLREELLLARQLLQAQAKFGQIDHTYLLSGWLPVSLFGDLRKRILEVTSGKALVEQVDPEEIKEVRSGILSIPILFNNPALIRPFERLTTLYGTPSYSEVEPTGLLALTFLLLFGMMFGDVGQGLVLFLLGYLIFKKMYRYLDYGIILMECGFSAVFFGLLYGSVFGLENLIPALWMHPMENIALFMKISALIGIGMISTGLVVNLVNTVRQHRYTEILSASGLAGALFYWLTAALAVRYFLAGALTSFEMVFARVAGGLLFALMVLQRPLRPLFSRHGGEKKGRLLVSGLGVTFLESLVEVLDELLRYVTNTVSFIRVGAFALAHAGLFMAVFTLADMVRSSQGSGIFYWMTLFLGNLVIIGLEGLVVSIQTVRLEYYEFFSKFFRGGGKPFQPLFEEKEEENS